MRILSGEFPGVLQRQGMAPRIYGCSIRQAITPDRSRSKSYFNARVFSVHFRIVWMVPDYIKCWHHAFTEHSFWFSDRRPEWNEL